MGKNSETLLRRALTIRRCEEKKGAPVIYWMSRDQRAIDNYALLFALEKAKLLESPLAVLFCLVGEFLSATDAQFYFMLKGLKETAEQLRHLGIPFFLLKGDPSDEIPKAVQQMKASALVTDFDPIKIKREWKKEVFGKIDCSIYEVDAHNVVPCFYASDKQEFSAFTFRKKVSNLIPQFLTDIPQDNVKLPEITCAPSNAFSIDAAIADIEKRLHEKCFSSLRFFSPGHTNGMRVLKNFIEKKLEDYSKKRNDALADVESGLSPYIHFGQISAQRIAFEVKKSGCNKESIDQFLEQLIIRREVADNFCYYNLDYDSVKGFPIWARQTLHEHIGDQREFIYNLEEFENAKTHDEVWNCAQIELRIKGKIHNYLRMYWGKKILEWSPDPTTALNIGNYLNNKYALDGRDPNGYVGVAWCIGGVHDRPFTERKIFGKIRYMSKAALERNFDLKRYVEQVRKLARDFGF